MTTTTFYKGFQIVKSGKFYNVWYAAKNFEFKLLKSAKSFVDNIV